MISTKKGLTDRALVIPRILSSKAEIIHPPLYSPVMNQYNFAKRRFASLADKEDFLELRPFLLEIDIHEALSLMGSDHLLEINVPVLGVLDAKKSFKYTKASQQFACVVGINGFGAKNKGTSHHFPRPDFVLLTDIIGNQYEMIVNADGSIELPEEGTGLFSIISSMTFIFSEGQVRHGNGLENLQANGLKENKLYLLPPLNSLESFVPKICVTHINRYHQRIVDLIHSVAIHFSPKLTNQVDLTTDVQPTMTETKLLHIDMALILSPLLAYKPFIASLKIDALKEVKLTFDSPKHVRAESHGWLQHPVDNNVFVKYFGLGEKTLTHIVKELYSQYDLMKDYLKGDTLSLSHENGYNNFMLRTEAFGNIYDSIIHDLVNHKMTGDFIFERVPQDRIADLDLSQYAVDFHDSVVLSHLTENVDHHLPHLFLSENGSSRPLVSDFINVYAEGLPDSAKIHASSEISFNTDFHLPLGSDIPLQETMLLEQDHHLAYFENQFNLGLPLPQQVIHLHDVMDMGTSSQKILDLGNLLETQATWTPLKQTKMLPVDISEGHSVDMKVSHGEIGDHIVITTMVQSQPATEIEIDPSHIHTHF